MTCEQEKCENPARWRFTWPGEAERHACTPCATKAVAIAHAMGFDLAVMPLAEAGKTDAVAMLLQAAETSPSFLARVLDLLASAVPDEYAKHCPHCRKG